MNETNLIERLQQNIKIVDNCTSNIRKTNKVLDDGSHNNNKPSYEMVNHPKHYNNYDVEVVDMMEKIWGTKAAMEWCKMTAFKYRMRMGTKPDQPMEQDLEKEKWYLKKADELKSKLLDKSIDMNQ